MPRLRPIERDPEFVSFPLRPAPADRAAAHRPLPVPRIVQARVPSRRDPLALRARAAWPVVGADQAASDAAPAGEAGAPRSVALRRYRRRALHPEGGLELRSRGRFP